MKPKNRPDLSNKTLFGIVLFSIACIITIVTLPKFTTPGSSLGQSSASIGIVFLLTPFLFSLFKRSGISDSPPSWFVAHVILSLFGSLLIAVHVSSANWFTPPGFVLFCLFFLLIQGALIRVVLTKHFSNLFAQSARPNGFLVHNKIDKKQLQNIIDKKISLLKELDNSSNEALFSPALKHWFYHPFKSIKYQLLANKEAKLIGIRQSAGFVLNTARHLHMLVAFLFFAGLLSHIIIILFFAGYVANGGDIDWWFITSWGG